MTTRALPWDSPAVLNRSRIDTVVVCAGQLRRRELPAPHVIGGAREAGELDAERAMREGVELGALL